MNEQQAQQRITLLLENEEATVKLGGKLAAFMRPGLVVYLRGNLGSGKTTLVRGLLRGLGFTGKVKSPTFTIVESYAISRLDLYHIDFYRFTNPMEWRDSGFREYFDGTSICIVEWPEHAGELLPPADIEIVFAILEQGRKVEVFMGENSLNQCLIAFQESSRS
jgi:tRNA threonylcarbamoyladenosine biosynthesis protein TsaE